ncbi:MAG TPA: hypothetical protein PLG99_02085 [Kaistiaceae bacterium]|nr:hypothetical protein [Kaistiaceae bacterium]
MTQIRLIPLVALAATALLVLKTIALVGEGGYVLSGTVGASAANDGARTEAAAADAAAGEAAPAGGTPAPLAADVAAAPDAAADPAAVPPPADGMTGMAGMDAMTGMGGMPGEGAAPEPAVFGERLDPNGRSSSEQALLSRLSDRRKELDKREAQLKLRESLLQAAEKRLEERVGKLKSLENELGAAQKKKEEERAAELARLISMYETMKPKDAAKVFDRLSIEILVDLARQMNPRKMAPILAQMSPDAAERLTVELATQGKGVAKPDDGPRLLPKIEGQPIQPGAS